MKKAEYDAITKVPAQALLHRIYNQIEEVSSQICDNYCKYPWTYDEEKEGKPLSEAVCEHCPINKLLEE